ncbi:GNAT family N-acetyltransferase [Candidatus Thorarchaeota archaeon]|nr:MAG: GNAT family N-acetyltransferase [Candidatus Thorarchaeota archaeon]
MHIHLDDYLNINTSQAFCEEITLKLAEHEGFLLRYAALDDFDSIDRITIICYTPIHDSWVSMHGERIYNQIYGTSRPWEESKTQQNHALFAKNPEWIWVLEKAAKVVGYVSFELNFPKSLGTILNNGILPEYAGKGLGKFMYRHVLDYFRKQGLTIAFVETGLDDPHIPARAAYEAVGFDRMAPIVLYWQDLNDNNPESFPEKH